MNTITKLETTEIRYIVKLLSLDTNTNEDILSNLNSIKLFASSLLDKVNTIESEIYSLSE